MLYSMTGFGKDSKIIKGKTISVEIRSLNSKGLDLNVRAPWIYKEKEIAIRKTVSRLLHRGKIDVFVTVVSSEETKSHFINSALAKSYYKEIKKLAADLKVENKDLLKTVMNIPNVIYPEKEVLLEKDWKHLEKALKVSLDGLIKFRKQEGAFMEKTLRTYAKKLLVLLKQLKVKEPGRKAAVRKKLKNNLANLTTNKKVDQDRFEQELIFYLEKLDISEEMSRLTNHLNYFIKEIGTPQIVKGKKLGFICQEIGREINTVGSKANDAGIQELIVQMKEELEKIKEQLDNAL